MSAHRGGQATSINIMDGLKIIPGPGVPDGLNIPETELSERFSRSSGPGGQNVNSTDSRVQLSFDLVATNMLSDAQQNRALRNLASRLDGGTVLTVTAATQRSQLRNRSDARERMATILREALAPAPPSRKKTKPTRGSIRRQRKAKLHRSNVKATRRRPDLL